MAKVIEKGVDKVGDLEVELLKRFNVSEPGKEYRCTSRCFRGNIVVD